MFPDKERIYPSIAILSWALVILSSCQGKDHHPDQLSYGKRFVSETQFRSNLNNQLNWTPKTLSKLKAAGINLGQEINITYYYYTNDSTKAKRLLTQLKNMNYSGNFEKDIIDTSQMAIVGQTNKIKMTQETLLTWTRKMCELGYRYDCDFDGWEVELKSR